MSASAISTFRKFANEIRQPSPYSFPRTELKGITNLALGAIQLLVSQYMKYSKSAYLNQLSARHVEIGKEALYRSSVQLMPAFLFFISAMCLIRQIRLY